MEYFSSDEDQRITNNAVRHEYRTLTDGEKATMLAIKDIGLDFVTLCDEIGPSREMSIAKTNIEQAVMWAVKAITK
jgi:hypothetical protein